MTTKAGKFDMNGVNVQYEQGDINQQASLEQILLTKTICNRTDTT